MKRPRIRGAVTGALFLLVVLMGLHTAYAQVPGLPTPVAAPTPPSLPPLPQPSFPPQTQIVFETLAPTVYPECGNATVGIIEVGQTLGAANPDLFALLSPQVFTAASPIFAICGQVPRPGTMMQCVLDAQQQAAINTVSEQAGAGALPLGLHPEGDVVEQTIVVEDQLPPPASSQGIGKIAASILGCAPIAQSQPSQGDYSSMPEGGSSSIPSYPLPGTSTTVGGISNTTPPSAPYPAVTTLPPARPTPVGEAIRYAIVWFLPLGLLFFGGYFGGALTREIEPRSA